MSKIEDFGEKIGGAKKDLFGTKGTAIDFSNMESWSARERKENIRKDNIFPKPDYRKLYESGVPKEICWFIKQIRDSIPTAPQLFITDEYKSAERRIGQLKPIARQQTNAGEKARQETEELTEKLKQLAGEITLQRQQEYIQQVGIVYEICQGIRTVDDMFQFQERAKEAGLFYDRRSQGMNDKTYEIIQIEPNNYQYKFMLQEMERKQFMMSADEKKVANDYLIIQYDGKNLKAGNGCLSVREDSENGEWWHHSYEDTSKSSSFFFEQENYEEGTYFVYDVKQKTMLGSNFATKEEAEDHALKIAKIIREGIKQAVSSYKESTVKEKLAVEYLDKIHRTGEDYREGGNVTGQDMLDIFEFRGGEFGTYENQKQRQINLNQSYDAFKDLAKILSVEDKDVSLGGQLALAFGARGHGNALAHYEPAANVINLTKMRGAGSLGHEWFHAFDAYVARELNLGNRFASRADNSPFAEVIQTMRQNPDGTPTKFLKDAQLIEKNFSTSGNQSKCYWSSNVEMLARAFHCYLLDKLKENGQQNDYLCGHAEKKPVQIGKSTFYTYPVGEERERINQSFDRLIDNMKEKELLHHQEHTAEKQRIDVEVDNKDSGEKLAALQQNAEILAEFDRVMDIVNEYFPDIEYYPDFDGCGSIEEVPIYVESALLSGINEQKGTNYYLQYGFMDNAVMKDYDKFVADTDNFQDMLSVLKDDVSKEERKIIRQQRKEEKQAADRTY